MARGLYIASTTPFAGKNTLIVGLGLRFAKEGLKLGYMKPVGSQPVKKHGRDEEADAAFIQDILGLHHAYEDVSPVCLNQDMRMRALSGSVDDYLPLIRKKYEALKEGVDLMLVSGAAGINYGRFCNLHGSRVAKSLDCKVLLVERMEGEIRYDDLLLARELLGEKLIGVVLNAVPPAYMAETVSIIQPFLEKNGIPVFGILPQNPLLGSIQVTDLAARLDARPVTGTAQTTRMVENFLIGTMQVENFMTYFRQRSNTAVIVGGDRADVQLVAIEGDCSCLVLTGNLYPNDIILSRADAAGVPILMAREDTFTTARKMESLLGRNKLRDAMKISQVSRLVNAAVDGNAIRSALGL